MCMWRGTYLPTYAFRFDSDEIKCSLVDTPVTRVIKHFSAVKQDSSDMGSGCGSVGIAVASGTRGPWFESSHRQNLY